MRRDERRAWRALRRLSAVCVMALAAAACDESDDDLTGPGGGGTPRQVEASYRWVFQGWDSGQPVGHPSVVVTWALPSTWNGESFRVYSRRTGQSDYTLIATVTSCAEGVCRYTDVNVRPGSTYEYYVTAVDERTGRESDGSTLSRLAIPPTQAPSAPAAPLAVPLDGAVFLRWESTGAERYWVLLESADAADLFDIGQTDGTGYLDSRAVNGNRYRYRLAAVDTLGQVSALSPVRVAVPRPDHQAELIYAYGDSAAASGFRFVASDSLNPVVPGNATTAQLRLEVIDGALSLVPLGGTTISTGVLTTALTCGPGSDPGCVAIASANDRIAPTDYAATPVAIAPELTYLVRVRGGDGRTRYGKIRISLEGNDQRGRSLVVFDWAYQLIADEPSLNRR